MMEEVAQFGDAGALVGVVTLPDGPTVRNGLPGVILLNAGRLHRVGPNRMYVRLARRLATAGFPVLRFDLSGIGDSDVRRDNLHFERSAVVETQAAMSYLNESKGVERFYLMGMCAGASNSIAAAWDDPRVAGAVLISPLAYSNSSEYISSVKSFMAARRFWRDRVFRPQSWLKALAGRADYRRGFSHLRNWATQKKKVSHASDQIADNLRSLSDRGVDLLLVYGTTDTGLDFLDLVLGRGASASGTPNNMTVEVIDGADHVFTLLRHQSHLLHVIETWALQTAGA